MINTKELKAAIARAGYTQEEVAKQIGISSYTFGKKAKNKSKFDVIQANQICDILGIHNNEYKAEIFLFNPSQNWDIHNQRKEDSK